MMIFLGGKRVPLIGGLLAIALLSQCRGPRVILPTLSTLQANAIEGVYPKGHEEKLTDHLIRAESTWNRLMRSPKSSRDTELRREYQQTVEAFIFASQKIMPPDYWLNGKVFVNDRARYRVEFVEDKTANEYPVTFFHELQPIKITLGKPAVGLLGEGIGAPMIGVIYRTKQSRKDYPLIPTNGARLPVTTILEFTGKTSAGGERIIKMHLRDTLEVQTVSLKRGDYPLAYNFEQPIDAAFRSSYWLKMSLRGLLRPNETEEFTQFYRLRPHAKERIPVVFIHGLNSNPHIWKNAVKAIMADGKLRKKYEPMCFAYSTGMPVLENAAELRRMIGEGMRQLDPEGDDPGTKHMILVGHSMGGLLTRLQTISTGMDFWNGYFIKPPSLLRVSDTTMRGLTSSLIFDQNPYLTRAVFIATPHRGSEVADFSIVRWIAALIRLPESFLQSATELLQFNRDAMNPRLIEYNMWPVSLKTMSPNVPFFQALNRKSPSIPYHSIIAKFSVGSLETSTDGVVPYESSHLSGAESEKIIPSFHSCVGLPAVTEELLRILRFHAAEAGDLSR